MKRHFEKKLATWLLVTVALLVLAACAQFTPDPPSDPPRHDIAVSVTGNGTVTSNVGNLDCSADGGAACGFTVDDGTEITLTATASDQAEMVTWGGACAGETGNTCTLTVNEDVSVTASFGPQGDPRLSVTVVGNGTVASEPAGIDCGETCTATFEAGSEVTLTATEAEGGDAFHSWGGECAGATGNTCTFTITQNSNVSATFGTPPEGFSVASASDDAEELVQASSDNPTAFPAGHTYTDSSDLDLVFDTAHDTTQFVGVRFSDVTIPAGATITSARIVFTAAGGSAGAVTVTVTGEASAAPATFVDDANNTGTSNISGRADTAASVDWVITEAWTAGNEYSSADLTSIVQEIVNLADWSSGNSMAFVFSGDNSTDYRSAQSFGPGRTAPVLHVTFSEPPTE
jgi:hypothetical protein